MKSNKNHLSDSHNTLINASASAINSFEELNKYITDKDIAEKIINNSIDVSTLKLGEDYNICWYTIVLKRNNRIVNNYIVPILIVKYYNYSNTPYYHMHAIPERVLECIYPAILSKNKKTIRTFFTPRVYSCDFSDVFFTKNYPAKIFSSFDIAETYRKSFEEYTRNAIKKAKEGYFTIREIADALGLETSNFKIIDSIENMNVLFDSSDHI